MKRCLIGFLGISVVGILLHNAYAWTKPFPLFALIAPVNESVWEHLKMAYWGVLIWAAIEGLFTRKKMKNVFPALVTGTLVFILTILIVFYSYTAFTQTSVLLIDIATFFVGAFFCQWISCRIRNSREMKRPLQNIALAILVGISLLFILFTFYPPEADIFRDHSKSQIETNHRFN